MGWCPCAKKPESVEWKDSLNFETPDQPGGGKTGNLRALSGFTGVFSRLSNQILLLNVWLTLNYFILLAYRIVNLKTFPGGLVLSLLLAALIWKKKMKKYDTIEKKPMVNISNRKRLLWTLLMILFAISGLFSYVARIFSQNMPIFYSFVITFMWISYLQIIYWERKNHMRICTKNEGGSRTIYSREVCPERKRELE